MSFAKMKGLLKRTKKKSETTNPQEIVPFNSQSQKGTEIDIQQILASHNIENLNKLFQLVENIRKAWKLILIFKDETASDNMLKLIRSFKEKPDQAIAVKLQANKNLYDGIKAFDNALAQFESAEKYFNSPPKFETSPELEAKREEERKFMTFFDTYKTSWEDKILTTLNEHGRKDAREFDKDRELIQRILQIYPSLSLEKSDEDNFSEDELNSAQQSLMSK